MLSEIGTLLVAVVLVYGIYKVLNAIFNTLPQSSLREFILSSSGKVFIGLISVIIFFAIFIVVMTTVLGIQC